MAKNWKRAHDALKLQADDLALQLAQAKEAEKLSRDDRADAMKRLGLACAHLRANSDHFHALNIPATARLIRDEANRLDITSGAEMVKAGDGRR